MLRQALPYLTYLTMFTYGFTSEGVLIDLEDEDLIRLAREYGVAPADASVHPDAGGEFQQ